MPFTVQARRILKRDTTRPLQMHCQIVPWNATSPRCRILHQNIFDILHAMKGMGVLARYHEMCRTSFHILLVPDARIIGVNGRTIPPEWLIEDSNARGNIMLIDARWTITDFTIAEVD